MSERNVPTRRGPRYVVRELTGYAISRGRPGGGTPGGTTVWVADDAMNGREVRVWRTEDVQKGVHVSRLERCRVEARALAERLNTERRRARD